MSKWTSPLHALYLLLREKEIDPTDTLQTLILSLDNFEELLLAVSLVSRFGAQATGYIDTVSVPVYIYRKLGSNPELLTSIFLIVNPFSLSSPAFSDKSITLKEYFDDHLYELPSPTIRTRTIKILLDKLEDLSDMGEIEEDVLEKYLIAAIKCFSHRCFRYLLKRCVCHATILRLFLQSISSLNLESFLLLLLAGYPILPLYREILDREIKISASAEGRHAVFAHRTLTSMLDISTGTGPYMSIEDSIELPPSLEYFTDKTSLGKIVVPAYWLTLNIEKNNDAEIFRSQRSALRRLGIPIEKRIEFPDTKVFRDLLCRAATLHGIPENLLHNVPLELQQKLFEYIGIPVLIERLKVLDTQSLFWSTVYFVIHQDPAYSTNFFMALNRLSSGFECRPRSLGVERKPSTALINAK